MYKPCVDSSAYFSLSSSFVIEFKEDGQHSCSGSQLGARPVQEGCFSRDLLNRDELSAGSSCSDSTEDREREGSQSDIQATDKTKGFQFMMRQE